MTNSSITVTTKSELESARKEKYEEIVVTGKLANELRKSKSIVYASAGALGIVIAAIAAMPVTGGLSRFAVAPVAALTGLEISAIIIAASLGISLILAIFKEYEEISYSDGKLILRKKQ